MIRKKDITFINMPSLFQLGEHFYTKGDHSKALGYFLRSADLDTENDTEKAKSFSYLGKMFRNGEGTPENIDLAVQLYKSSAKLGWTPSMFTLGTMYEHGRGVKRDYSEAIVWYSLGSKLGHTGCQINLGCMYDSGAGTPQDFKKAYEQYLLAAEQGDIDATYNLAMMHEHGEHVPKNQTIANRLYCEAGEYNLSNQIDYLEVVEESTLNRCSHSGDSCANKYDLEGALNSWINQNIVVQSE
jgi:TPR repeat protein